jgi:hypothetical protein
MVVGSRQRESPKERAPPPDIAKGVGLQRVPPPPCVSLWADGVEDYERKGVRRDEEAYNVVDHGSYAGAVDVIRGRGVRWWVRRASQFPWVQAP